MKKFLSWIIHPRFSLVALVASFFIGFHIGGEVMRGVGVAGLAGQPWASDIIYQIDLTYFYVTIGIVIGLGGLGILAHRLKQ